MSSFHCEKCGKTILDSEQGYYTFCKHYPLEISMKDYNKKMNEIIKMGKPVSDTLADMLKEANKHTIKVITKK